MLGQSEFNLEMERLCAAVGTPAMREIDREITPILAELLTLKPGYIDDNPTGHPAVKLFFNWLMEPERKGEEFSYVIGALLDNVWEIMYLNFPDYLYNPNSYSAKYSTYPDKVAVEALAARCLVLEGQWEQVAWLMVTESAFFGKYPNESATNCLSVWIIQMIGNPDSCPNLNLRIRLMILLNCMVDLSDHNWTQALESVMCACSFLNENYPDIYITIVTETLQKFAEGGYLLMVDEILSKDLSDMKTSRLSAFVQDAAYNLAVKKNMYSHPVTFHSLSALLKTICGCTRVALRQDDADEMVDMRDLTTDLLQLITSNFVKTCQTPQLVQLTISCLRDVRQLVINTNVVRPYSWSLWSLDDINTTLDKFIN